MVKCDYCGRKISRDEYVYHIPVGKTFTSNSCEECYRDAYNRLMDMLGELPASESELMCDIVEAGDTATTTEEVEPEQTQKDIDLEMEEWACMDDERARYM